MKIDYPKNPNSLFPKRKMSRQFGMQTQSSVRVILNVYDLSEVNMNLYPLGLGMYHSGVQVGGVEWSFASGAGVFQDSPKSVQAFRESIFMGEFQGNSRDIDAILDDLRPLFHGNSYNLLSQNCNSFAEAFCLRLLNKSIPGFVNRMANMGSMISCLLPESVTNQSAPVGDTSGNSSSGSGNSHLYSSRSYSSSNPVQAFQGSASKLGSSSGSSTEMKSMPIESSVSNSNSQDSVRRARLNALGIN